MNQLTTKQNYVPTLTLEEISESNRFELSDQLKKYLPAIKEADLNIREIGMKHNTNFMFDHMVVGAHWTPLSAIRQCYAEIRNIKQAIRFNAGRSIDHNLALTSDDIDGFDGLFKALSTLSEKVNAIKKNHDLPEVIPNEMWEKDQARSQVMKAFQEGYQEAMGSGRGTAQTGYTRFAHQVGIGAMQFQSEILNFLNKFSFENPASFEQEFTWVNEMGDKYKNAPFEAEKLKGYATR